MAEFNLTQPQQDVVDDRGGALLVSAAAGSGKTRVLIERLMSRICDQTNPCNIDDFLIITYTRAAAAELRLKIAQALSQRLAEQPGNRHLHRQLHRIYLAQISTVHSFCSDLLRTYAHQLDIPADFRVTEEVESAVLQNKVLDKLLAQRYTQNDEDFFVMVDTFGYGRDDRRLADAVKMARKAMICRADMDRWLSDTIHSLEMDQYTDVGETPWGIYVMDGFRGFLDGQIVRLEQSLDEMQNYPKILKALEKTFRENVLSLKRLRGETTWDGICGNLIVSFGRIGVVRQPEDPAVKTRLSAVRAQCWADLKRWQELFYAPSVILLEDLRQVTPAEQTLLRFAKEFDNAYAAEKKRRKLMDFSDLEHQAIRLLTDKYTKRPSKLAQEISGRYVEIMVDEYQDSNQVQEVIFESISRDGRNRFMVGDVKQSIYRFRLADPTLFLKKYSAYPNREEASEGMPRKILLSENFRSRPEILSACNDVFRLVMRKSVGDLDYGDDEALRPGGSFPNVSHSLVELHCLTSSNPEADLDKRDLEAEYVASRIKCLLDEQTPVTDSDGIRPVKPSDIVILMRSVSGNAQAYLEALKRHGIPAVSNRGGSLLDTTEIQILTALLQIIDNPHQDVPLLTVMASPVFGFAPDELAQPRIKQRKDDLYDTIQVAGERFWLFLELLDQLRDAARWMPLQELIDFVFRKTGMISVFASMADGLQREKNLMAFRSFVVGFEANGSRALPELLWHLSDLQDNGGQLPIPACDTENAVTVMTIHKSKGLEFPVVFLSDLSRQFNVKDMQEAILVDDQLAVGCNRVDSQRFVRYPTLAKKSIEHKKRQESISEELRILYVAMTRAKDMLVMTYYSKRLLKELEAINTQLTMPLSDDLCASVNNPGKWILMAALCRTEAGELLNLVEGNGISRVSEYPWKVCYRDLFSGAKEQGEKQEEPHQNLMQPDPRSLSLLDFRYGKDHLRYVPAKLTATQLKGRVQDQEASEQAVELVRHSAYQFRKPQFLSRELTAAEKGTATHLFMQFADYERCTTMEGLEEELHRLRLHQFLTSEQAEAVQLNQILSFFQSDLGSWLLSRSNVQREFKFSVLVDAERFYVDASGEQVMLQGVVDCFVQEDDGITILDFKTDRVGKELDSKAAYYGPQLEAYANALSRIYEMPVKKKILYFFSAGKSISL